MLQQVWEAGIRPSLGGRDKASRQAAERAATFAWNSWRENFGSSDAQKVFPRVPYVYWDQT